MIELRRRPDPRYAEVSVEVDHRNRVAEVGFAPGCERYLALCLHELVASGDLDARVVQHWFELCAKGDGPKVSKR